MNLSAVILIVVVVGIFLFMLLVGVPWRIRRAMRQMIQVCREQNATSAKNAITMAELGIKPRTLLRPLLLRDYKKPALDMLVKEEIIKMTEDSKFYIVEENITGTTLEEPMSRYG